MLWNIELKFCIWLSVNELKIKFECHQFSSILWVFCSFWNFKYWIYLTFLLRPYWPYILYTTFFLWTSDQVRVSSICVGVMPLSEIRILEIHSFRHLCFDILTWTFVYDFLFMDFRSSDWHYLGSNLKELCLLWMYSYARLNVLRLSWSFYLTFFSYTSFYYYY